MIKQENELVGFIGDIEFDRLGAKEDRKNRVTDSEYHMNNKDKHKKMREDDKRSKALHNCKMFVCLVLEFGMDYIKNLRL